MALEDAWYFARTEGAFLRYKRRGDHWEAQARNGVRFIYGESAAARVSDGAGRVFPLAAGA